VQLGAGLELQVLRQRQVAVLQLQLQLVPLRQLFGMRVLKMTGSNRISFVTLIGAVACFACSDDSYIATNNANVVDAGNSGGEAGEESGGSGGSSGGVSGSAGSASGGSAGGGGACTPGEQQVLGTCEKCGSSTQTCDENGSWGAAECLQQGACTPGETSTSGCSDPCSDKKCGTDCSWGTCGLKSGANCLYEGGSNFKCCGVDHWQFCNASTCDWYSCQPCAAGSSCLSAC
jgi:hypothetical protein